MNVLLISMYQEHTFLYCFWAVITFFIGCCMGSFLNVCIWRMPLGESVVTAPSHCPKCNHKIRWYENIPLISFLALHAKCSSCKEPITWRYFIVELVTGMCFIMAFLKITYAHQFFSMIIPYGAMIMLAIASAFIDYKHRIIPNQLTYTGVIIGLLFFAIMSVVQNATLIYVMSYVIQVVGVAIFFYLFSWIGRLIFKRDAFGLGDVKYVIAITALSGSAKFVIITLLFASILGVATGVLVARKNHQSIKSVAIPFAPFMAIGTLIAIMACV